MTWSSGRIGSERSPRPSPNTAGDGLTCRNSGVILGSTRYLVAIVPEGGPRPDEACLRRFAAAASFVTAGRVQAACIICRSSQASDDDIAHLVFADSTTYDADVIRTFCNVFANFDRVDLRIHLPSAIGPNRVLDSLY